MIGHEILVRIRPEKRTEFLQAFDMLKTDDQLTDSRLEMELYEQVNESNAFLWLEHWDNDEALTRYYEENRYRAMMGAIEILGQLVHIRTFSIEGKKQNA
jgi:quinol monooxygenase YgiN